MIPAKWNSGIEWVDCFLLKVEREHYGIKCIIAVEATDGNGLELMHVNDTTVRIKRTRISLTKEDTNG